MTKAPGLALRVWLAATWAISPFLRRHLLKRRARGKELPDRWHEKLGHATAPRPEGRLIWLHAVGLGEVLALRGLIARLSILSPDLHFLVTSGTRTSAQVFARNLPPRTTHQFAPLDAPAPARRFLDHWRPDLSIWAEQELWPGLVWRADKRAIPLALVNARMNDAALARRRRGRGLYADILPRFALISAQDDATARNLATLGAPAPRVDGSLKLIAPDLADAPEQRAALAARIGDRPLWLAASTHATDEALALDAHSLFKATHPGALLILAPRLPERAEGIAAAARSLGHTVALRSRGDQPGPQTDIYLADSFGEMGLWYRIAPAALIGGSTGPVQGHNPWEAARLGCAILHGAQTANFAADYTALHRADAARQVDSPQSLAHALADPTLPAMATRARALSHGRMDRLDGLCHKLLDLL